jgi:hypothetical protein
VIITILPVYTEPYQKVGGIFQTEGASDRPAGRRHPSSPAPHRGAQLRNRTRATEFAVPTPTTIIVDVDSRVDGDLRVVESRRGVPRPVRPRARSLRARLLGQPDGFLLHARLPQRPFVLHVLATETTQLNCLFCSMMLFYYYILYYYYLELFLRLYTKLTLSCCALSNAERIFRCQ